MRLSALPSEYFKRQCLIATDVDEELLPVVIDRIGDDKVVVSVDYPHADGPFPHGIDTFSRFRAWAWNRSARSCGATVCGSTASPPPSGLYQLIVY